MGHNRPLVMWFYLLPAAVNFIAKDKSFKKHLLLWISSIDKFLKFKCN